jgi:hypothetical protein
MSAFEAAADHGSSDAKLAMTPTGTPGDSEQPGYSQAQKTSQDRAVPAWTSKRFLEDYDVAKARLIEPRVTLSQ